MIKTIRVSGLERVELKRLTTRVARLFAALQEAIESEAAVGVNGWSPPVDVCETPERICVLLELPGVSADQIRLGLTSTQLRISGEKKRIRARQRTVSHLCLERSYGRFNRIIPLRWPIRVSDARAELANGMLVIHIPKIRDRRGAEFRIPIKETESRK